MNQIRTFIACAALLIVFVPGGGGSTTTSFAALEGIRASASASPRGCLLNVTGSLRADAANPRSAVRASVDATCTVHLERMPTITDAASGTGSKLAMPMAAPTRSCWGDNWTYDAVQEWKALLRDIISFDHDGSSIVSFFDYGAQAYAQNGLYVHDGPVNYCNQCWNVPTWYHMNDATASYWELMGWNSDKENELYGYGDGSCSMTYSHSGWVPQGGWVYAEILYFGS